MDANLRTFLLVLLNAALLAVAPGKCSQQSPPNPLDTQSLADRDSAEARRVFETRCAGCHGLDARGGERAPDIATRPSVLQRSDSDLAHIIKTGIPDKGMPAFATLDDSTLASLVRYLRILQGSTAAAKLPGVPESGKTAFFGAARCANCHVVNGQGGFIGSDLSAFARNRSVEEIRQAITKPATENRHSRVIEASTKSGQKYSGIIRNEDNFSVQLQSLDGGFHFLLRSDIASLVRRQESLMPLNYGSTLSREQLNDLISFLMSVANEAKFATINSKTDEENE